MQINLEHYLNFIQLKNYKDKVNHLTSFLIQSVNYINYQEIQFQLTKKQNLPQLFINHKLNPNIFPQNAQSISIIFIIIASIQYQLDQQFLLQPSVTPIMFPNDDICNIDAAKGAAARLFRRYKNTEDKSQPIIGKSEVNRLMKATYDAINMPYDPNEEEVFSFISVFDTNNDGRIQLKDLEAMAVKYLCGEDAFLKLSNPEEKNGKQKEAKEKQVKEQLILGSIISQHSSQLNKSSSKTQIKEEKIGLIKIKKPLTIQTNISSFRSSKVYTPSANNGINLNSYFSPKSRISFRDSMTSANTQTMTMKTEIVSQNQRQDDIFRMGRQLFDNNMNAKIKGISEAEAGNLMSLTYGLLGKKSLVPKTEDIKIWIKLCDRNKDGVVDWQDYRYFLQKSYERERSKVKN